MNYLQASGKSIEDGFAEFDRLNPNVYKRFEERVMQHGAKGGYASAKTVICDLRQEAVATNRTDEFRINDAYSACYARKFQSLHPDKAHYLKVRNLRRKGK